MLLKDWMQAYYEDMERKGARCLRLLKCTMRLLGEYNDKVTMREVDRAFCTGFMEFLQYDYKTKGASPSPQKRVRLCRISEQRAQRAVRAEVIGENPFMQLTPKERIQVPESKREFSYGGRNQEPHSRRLSP